MSINVAAAIAEGCDALATATADPRRETEILLGEVTGKSRSQLIAWPEHRLTGKETTRHRSFLRRRAQGEPVAYILGHREFWSLELRVSPATLIPRHETELLVELALARIPENGACRVLDLGTGSGAIALAIASERPAACVHATDVDQDALKIARENAAAMGLGRVELASGDWFGAIGKTERFHIIVSNPPYVAEDDPHLARGDLRWEPRCALVAGADGLADIRRIAADARSRLEPGGWLLLEHGPEQHAAVEALLLACGLTDVECHEDLIGLRRVTVARREQ